LALADQFKIPVKFIGVGEKATDLLVFDKQDFVDGLFQMNS
jgi:fused signal recognition particle receptor